jgi:hypothetical protein
MASKNSTRPQSCTIPFFMAICKRGHIFRILILLILGGGMPLF